MPAFSVSRMTKVCVRRGAVLLGCMLLAPGLYSARCQVAPASVRGDEIIFVGAAAAAQHIEYGSQNLYGPRIFVDASFSLKWGAEGSALSASLHPRDGVSQGMYVAGPRYTFAHRGRFTFAAKSLVGSARFRFPYGYAQGSYFALVPGADVNYKLNRRLGGKW